MPIVPNARPRRMLLRGLFGGCPGPSVPLGPRVTATLRTEVAPVDPAAMTDGENAHDIPAGRSEQEREMGLIDPDCAVTAMPGLLSCPSMIVTEDGEARRAM